MRYRLRSRTGWPGVRTASLGLVVKASASGADDLGFQSRLRRDLSWSSHTCQASGMHYKVYAGTGRPGVSIL